MEKDKEMDKMRKYSIAATPEAMEFFTKNGIRFIYTKGRKTGRFRLFFITDKERAIELTHATRYIAIEEVDDWDFVDWDVLAK